MRYLVLLMGPGELPAWGELSASEQEEAMARFAAFDAACAARDGVSVLAGEALGDGDTATVLRTRGGRVSLTDGPYAEAVEQLGGFYLVQAPDLDVLVDLLALLPPYDMQIVPAIDVA